MLDVLSPLSGVVRILLKEKRLFLNAASTRLSSFASMASKSVKRTLDNHDVVKKMTDLMSNTNLNWVSRDQELQDFE